MKVLLSHLDQGRPEGNSAADALAGRSATRTFLDGRPAGGNQRMHWRGGVGRDGEEGHCQGRASLQLVHGK